MKSLSLALISALAFLLPHAALAQPQGPYPPALLARVKTIASMCTALGGKLGNGDRPLVYEKDFSGDGKTDWILDSAGFGCIGKPNLFRTANGATLEVFTSDGAGGAKSALITTAYTFRVTDGKPAKLFVTQRGPACGSANAICEKPALWNASSKKFALGADSTVVAKNPAPAGGAANSTGGAASGGFSGPAFTVSAADKAAAFKAAGFEQTKRGWQSCTDDLGADALSYSPGEVTDTPDLNKDGRPEIWIHEGGGMCYGNSGGLQVFLAKTSAGQWEVLLSAVTDPTILPGRTNGWANIQDGGPGMGPWGTWRFDGSKYVFKKP